METKKPMNADIEFLSAEHVLEEIDGMRVKGGSPFGRSAAWAFKKSLEARRPCWNGLTIYPQS